MISERSGFYTKRTRISEARLNFMLDAYSAGKTSPQELEAAARGITNRIAARVGKRAEDKFTEFALSLNKVKALRNASINDDVFQGIDKWISFNDELGIPTLPVQIKSSEKGVKEYKKTRQFKNLNEAVIVINCSYKVTKDYFGKQLESETRRILKILNKDS